MDNVVYMLGAGFSAPLGLPVMSNFIEMSKDLYASDNIMYRHFSKVFDSIRKRLAYITQFYSTDLDNIEEVLSILEMERLAGRVSREETDEYIRFIVDVIQHYTPPITGLRKYEQIAKGYYRTTDDRQQQEFEFHVSIIEEQLSQNYIDFILQLFHAQLIVRGVGDTNKKGFYREFELHNEIDKNPSVQYSVITLNYDLVLENYANYLSSISQGTELKFTRPRDRRRQHYPYLVKLHGSIDNHAIIPPTWNKTINAQISTEWKMAYKLLSSANYIRIVGYSLPNNDAYVRYLLKASILKSENLKRIDVLCKDDSGIVRERYDSFITLPYPKYRFCNGYVERYLSIVKHYFELSHDRFYKEYEEKDKEDIQGKS
ncbi:MAG: hypothetical protein MUO30_11730 [Anaerolineales bacterium]|nr:hypothetical protein [Anaerolineales bacterium]